MSGIDKRHYGLELGLSVPVWNGLSVVGALSWGDYTYTSNPDFVQTVDNVDKIVLRDKVSWDGYHVESTPQLALNVGLDYRGPQNWFASVNFNYYDDLYLSMNPMYRTAKAIEYYTNILSSSTSTTEQQVSALRSIKTIRAQERFDRCLYAERQRGQELVYPPRLHAGLQPRGEEHSQQPGYPYRRLRADAYEPRARQQRRDALQPFRFEVFLHAGYELLSECLFPILTEKDHDL